MSVDLDPDLDAPAAARALVARFGAGVDPTLVADAVLCVSELVTNAVVHGRPRVTVDLALAGSTLAVRVTDHGDGFDPTEVVPAADDSVGGRGLYLVATLARRWGVVPGRGGGTTVWFELVAADPASVPAGRHAGAVG